MATPSLSVKQLNFYVKSLIEGDPRLNCVYVSGEISNLKRHYQSGHIYFTLKDSDAAINCVMFRSFASYIKFEPQNGMQVLIRGRVSVYEKDGKYQIYAEEMCDAGLGDIALKFEQTKKKLTGEGLFNPESKRAIPKFPKKIAVVTSESGAAVRDIFNILSRRWPVAEVIMCPVAVQGEFAVPEMLAALDKLYTLDDIDLCIIGRGGGSAEDLWAFNDEKLAYKIFESPFPVISAVGHETDFTICDFVSDLRAPTPSAAAELAVPDCEEFYEMLKKQRANLLNLLKGKYENCRLRFEKSISSPVITNPVDIMINKPLENIDRLTEKMKIALNLKLTDLKSALAEKSASLDALSPLKTLSRGYASVRNKGKIVQRAEELKAGDNLNILLADGEVNAAVTEVKVK